MHGRSILTGLMAALTPPGAAAGRRRQSTGDTLDRRAAPAGGGRGARRQEADAEIVAQRSAGGRLPQLRRRYRGASAARRHHLPHHPLGLRFRRGERHAPHPEDAGPLPGPRHVLRHRRGRDAASRHAAGDSEERAERGRRPRLDPRVSAAPRRGRRRAPAGPRDRVSDQGHRQAARWVTARPPGPSAR